MEKKYIKINGISVATKLADFVKNELLENTEVDLSSIRLCISAGEALPPDLLRRWIYSTTVL